MADRPELIADPVRDIGIFWGHGPPPSDFLPGETSEYHDDATGDVYELVPGSGWVQLGTGGGSTSFTSLTGIPTTVAGYGITDVYTKTASDARYLQLSGGTLSGGLFATGITRQIRYAQQAGLSVARTALASALRLVFQADRVT